jgi:peptidoglycan/LPS O-acetylase OafA/YrhL
MALARSVPAARPRSATAAQAAARLAYIDNLRVLLITMLIVHHAGQAYGPDNGVWPIFNPTRVPILDAFFTVNASFGLGLFFLIAGYFVPAAYDRKGARRFLTDRLLRLGVPLLFVSLVLFPLFLYLGETMQGHGQPFGAFLATYLRWPEVGHMWFVSHLIIYTCGYAVWRWLARPAAPAAPAQSAAPGHRALLGYALALALVTFIVRIGFPIDDWIYPVPFVRVELARLPQHLSMFVLGIVAYRRDWLRQMPTKTGMTWLAIGLAVATLPYANIMLRSARGADQGLFLGGGLSVGSLARSMTEAFLCAGLGVGLLTLLHEHVNRQGALMRELAVASYTVYAIHIFPVVFLQGALLEWPVPALAKFGLVTLITVPLCYALGYGLRKLPGVRRVV